MFTLLKILIIANTTIVEPFFLEGNLKFKVSFTNRDEVMFQLLNRLKYFLRKVSPIKFA